MARQNPRKLKRVVIKEELVVLTGDWLSALILNQFLYWGERVKDFDKFIQEERERDPDTRIELAHGWIYKSTKELKDELMVDVDETTIRRRIKKLVKKSWIDERHNPDRSWDRTLQYRPNIRRIQADLQKLGYALDRYLLLIDEDPNLHGAECNQRDAGSNLHHAESNLHDAEAIPETTTEITETETTTEITTTTTDDKEMSKSETNVVVALTNQDIAQNIAQRLASRHTLNYVEEKIDFLAFLQETDPDKVKNPRGWLRCAIEENYSAPDGYEPEWRGKVDEDEEILKYITGKYSEFIEH